MTAPVQPSLTTARLVLRPFVREDAREVQRLAGDSRIAESTLVPHPYPDGLAESWIDGHGPSYRAGREVVYAVTQREGGRLVGAVSLLSVSETHARAEVGFWIGTAYWGRGYCTEAVRALMDFAAASLGITRFVGRCVASNLASAAVMAKAGMSPEGRLPKHEFRGGRYVDQLLFGCLLPGRGTEP
ncbi:GNAT family N-acetyltransferase [Ramlibacter sp.]|uniref:GNAT family N-acetyltransferase n=1 Tax=Ramlibacter sp. TaxID=1917967 RepID=UPI002CBEA5EE|nr:GNAT family N-acetyltransferase [Ramlibacter sp.]HWI83619.1 GNAT family N-acetyltransferase [Ramlibacter sp.]